MSDGDQMRFAALVILSVALLSCGDQSPEGRVFRIPWPADSGRYRLQNVTIESFDNHRALQGRFVRIFVKPFVRDGRVQSELPVGRFIERSDGVLVPADYVSLQATVLHAHLERLAKLNSDLGIPVEWPLQIGIEANVRDPKGQVLNNAIFDSQLDALLVVPYRAPHLPIVVNAGIIAHEHFHKVFHSLVLSRLAKPDFASLGGRSGVLSHEACGGGSAAQPLASVSAAGVRTQPTARGQRGARQVVFPADIYNQFYLRALNEGLADYWAWVYTGDANFLFASLPKEANARRLDQAVYFLPSKVGLKNLVFRRPTEEADPYRDEILVGNAYALGSQYARVLRELTVATTSDRGRSLASRLKGARAVIRALEPVALAFARAQTSRELLPGDLLMKALYPHWPEAEGWACRIFQRVTIEEMGEETGSIEPSFRCGKSPPPAQEPTPEPAPTPVIVEKTTDRGEGA